MIDFGTARCCGQWSSIALGLYERVEPFFRAKILMR